MLFKRKVCNYKKYERSFGTELIVINTDKYCAKILDVNPMHQSSCHLHPIKDETFIAIDFGISIKVGDEEIILGIDESLNIPPQVSHTIINRTDRVVRLIEVSTKSNEEDNIKFYPGGPIDTDV